MRKSNATQLVEPTKATATTDLDSDGVVEISGALRQLLADVFAFTQRRKISTGT
jgi:hypothetical protein